MEEIKVYLDKERSGFVVCKKCGESKQISFADDESPHPMVVQCACGNDFSVVFESRRHYRKKVNTYGKCFAAGDVLDGALVQLMDISQSGVTFKKVDGRPLKLNEKIRVSFQLGDGKLDCAASIHNIRKSGGIGAKFINIDEHSKKVLGFFLLP